MANPTPEETFLAAQSRPVKDILARLKKATAFVGCDIALETHPLGRFTTLFLVFDKRIVTAPRIRLGIVYEQNLMPVATALLEEIWRLRHQLIQTPPGREIGGSPLLAEAFMARNLDEKAVAIWNAKFSRQEAAYYTRTNRPHIVALGDA